MSSRGYFFGTFPQSFINYIAERWRRFRSRIRSSCVSFAWFDSSLLFVWSPNFPPCV
eukprot:UN00127